MKIGGVSFKKIIYYLLPVLLALGISSAYDSYIVSNTRASFEQQMQIRNKQNALLLEAKLHGDKLFLRDLYAQIALNKIKLNSEELRRFLELQLGKSEFSRLIVADLDGNAIITGTQGIRNITNAQSYKDALQGKTVLHSTTTGDLRERRKVIRMAMPIVVNNKIKGVIIGSYVSGNMLKRLDSVFFGYQTDFCIADSKGQLVAGKSPWNDGIIVWAPLDLEDFANAYDLGWKIAFSVPDSVVSSTISTYILQTKAFGYIMIIIIGLLSGYNIYEQYRRRRHAELESRTDALTNLLNRRGVTEKVSPLLNRTGAKGALLVLDLDNFKIVNDSYGHQVGDKVLVDFAELLCTTLPQGAYIARYGGDEFMAYLPNIQRESVDVIINLVKKSMRHRFICYDKSCGFGVSIGCVYVPDDGKNMEDLFHKADELLYESKRSKKSITN